MAGKSHLEGQLVQSPSSSLAAPSGPSPPGCAVCLSPQVDRLWRIRSDWELASLLSCWGLPRDSAPLQALPSVMGPWGRHSQLRVPRDADAAPTAWPGTQSPQWMPPGAARQEESKQVGLSRSRTQERDQGQGRPTPRSDQPLSLQASCQPTLFGASAEWTKKAQRVGAGRQVSEAVTLLPALGVAAGGASGRGRGRRWSLWAATEKWVFSGSCPAGSSQGSALGVESLVNCPHPHRGLGESVEVARPGSPRAPLSGCLLCGTLPLVHPKQLLCM